MHVHIYSCIYHFQLTLTFICLAATHSLFITATVRCFGNEHKATNYGLLILSTVRLIFICINYLNISDIEWNSSGHGNGNSTHEDRI